MANPPVPPVTKRAPTIDFIDQKLAKYHPVFASQTVQYDQMAGRYISTVTNHASSPNTDNSLVSQPSSNLYQQSSLPVRPHFTDVNAMTFWDGIFPESMVRFTSTKEPKGRSGTQYNIRDKSNWDEIYQTLESARRKYQDTGGRVGWVRRVRRKIADNITPGVESARIATKVVPQDQISTPIVGAVEVLLDAIKVAATVRGEVLTGLDGLIPIFSDVETFLSTFPDDANIRLASIELVATTLSAVERTIGFYISNELVRGGKAIVSGADYEKGLCESLEAIQVKAQDLVQQALKSHIFASQIYSQETQRMHQRIIQRDKESVAALNSIERLLNGYLLMQERQFQIEREERKLLAQNFILASTSPMQQWNTSPQALNLPAPYPQTNQNDIRTILNSSELDVGDWIFVAEKKEQLRAKDLARAEQIVQTQLFANWIMSTSSAKLLVHWNSSLPNEVANVSPLSIFCMTLARSVKSKDRFISVLWFCGRHVDATEPGARIGGCAMILSLIDQLLGQFEYNIHFLQNHVDIRALEGASMETWISLLVLLVRQLPRAMTLFFIIDGVYLFEREEFEADATPIFKTLLQLTNEPDLAATVKLLFTSTPGTDVVRVAFEQDDLILEVSNLPRPDVASEERMIREIEGEQV